MVLASKITSNVVRLDKKMAKSFRKQELIKDHTQTIKKNCSLSFFCYQRFGWVIDVTTYFSNLLNVSTHMLEEKSHCVQLWTLTLVFAWARQSMRPDASMFTQEECEATVIRSCNLVYSVIAILRIGLAVRSVCSLWVFLFMLTLHASRNLRSCSRQCHFAVRTCLLAFQRDYCLFQIFITENTSNNLTDCVWKSL